MLLVDGVKYELWNPPSEEELERIVIEHAQEIFSTGSAYFSKKSLIKTSAGIGSIPDGIVLVFGSVPQWHIVEVELSSHDVYQHVVPQVDKFIYAVENASSKNKIVDSLYKEIYENEELRFHIRQRIGQREDIHKFLSDLISTTPFISIIIEKETPSLREALKKYQRKNIVEFQTFIREGVGLPVHIHLFEPLVQHSQFTEVAESTSFGQSPYAASSRISSQSLKAKPVTFNELLQAGLIHDGEYLHFYHTRVFPEEKAKIIVGTNQVQYSSDGNMYSKSLLAKKLLIKHGFKNDDLGVAGPRYWKTEKGQVLRDLEERIRDDRGDRT